MAESNIEEVYIYAELAYFDHTEILNSAKSAFLSDLTSNHPKATFNKLDFTGKHAVNLGSMLFFEKHGAKHELIGHSVKKLRLDLSHVNHDVVSDNEQNDDEESENEDNSNDMVEAEILSSPRKETATSTAITIAPEHTSPSRSDDLPALEPETIAEL